MASAPIPLLLTGHSAIAAECLTCGVPTAQGAAYLSGGSGSLAGAAFLTVGVHAGTPGERDLAQVPMVADMPGGRFELRWCSLTCMQAWWHGFLCEVTTRVEREQRERVADAEPGAAADGGGM
jgi:hypothetical protein